MLGDMLDYHSNMPKIGVYGGALNRTADYQAGRDLRVVMRNLGVTGAKKQKEQSTSQAERFCRNWVASESGLKADKPPSTLLSCPCIESELEDWKNALESGVKDKNEIHAIGGGNWGNS